MKTYRWSCNMSCSVLSVLVRHGPAGPAARPAGCAAPYGKSLGRRPAGGGQDPRGDAGPPLCRRRQGHRRGGPGQRRPARLPALSQRPRLHLDGKYDEAIAVFDQLGQGNVSQEPLGTPGTLCQGRLAGPQGRLPQRRADLSGRGRVPALDRSQAADRRHLPGICRHLLQAAQGRAEARLRQGPGVLQEGIGDRRPSRRSKSRSSCSSASASRTWASSAEAAALFEKFQLKDPSAAQSLLRRISRPATGSASAAWRKAIAREARRVWQDLLAKYVDSQSPRVADAQFDLSRTWNIPNPGDDEQLNLGTAALRAFLERFPKHANAGRAHLEIAQSYLNRGRPARCRGRA